MDKYNRSFDRKPFYTVTEIAAITGLSRQLVCANFERVSVAGRKSLVIMQAELNRHMNPETDEAVKRSDLPANAQKKLDRAEGSAI